MNNLFDTYYDETSSPEHIPADTSIYEVDIIIPKRDYESTTRMGISQRVLCDWYAHFDDITFWSS